MGRRRRLGAWADYNLAGGTRRWPGHSRRRHARSPHWPPRGPRGRQLLPRQTESPQERALREIAEATGGRFWNADSSDRLRQAFAAIADAMGHRYVLSYEPTGVARNGWHRIEARLRGVRGEVHVRRGYWGSRN